MATRSELFRAKIAFDDTGCHVWTASLDKDGYGQFRDGDKITQAHRWGWEYARKEPVPEGFELDHLCRNRRCVNPEHLELVTHSENIKRQREAQARLVEEKAEKSERTQQRERKQLRDRQSIAVARALEPLEAALWCAELGNHAGAAEAAARIVTAGRPEGEVDVDAVRGLAAAAADEMYAEARAGSNRFAAAYLSRAFLRAVVHLDKMTPLVPPQNSSFHARTLQQMRDDMGGDLTAWANVIVDFGDLADPDEAKPIDEQLVSFLRKRGAGDLADAIEKGEHLL